MTIYFGSQTGTAESYARTLRTEGTRAGFLCSVSDLEKFDVTELRRQRLVCFVMATYGEGDPTDNAVSFMQWLRQAAESDSRVLEGVSFTVFGLGNRQYQHYNRMGRDVNKLLEKMGGNRAFPYGEGDDDASLERDFEAWKVRIVTAHALVASLAFACAYAPHVPRALRALRTHMPTHRVRARVCRRACGQRWRSSSSQAPPLQPQQPQPAPRRRHRSPTAPTMPCRSRWRRATSRRKTALPRYNPWP